MSPSPLDGTLASAPTVRVPEAAEMNRAPTHATRWVGESAFALSLVGVGLSTYITIAHFTEATILACSGRGELSCTAVTTSPESRVFGVPVALVGLGFFAVMSVLSSPPLWGRGTRWLAMSRSVLALAGLLFILWLIAAELLIIGHVCLWCTGVHVVMFAIVLVLTRATPVQLGLRGDDSGA